MEPLSSRVYEVIQEHDLLMRNVAAVAKQQEMLREAADGTEEKTHRKIVTHEHAAATASALIKRGHEAAQRREIAQRNKERQEMAAVTARPRISARSRQLVAARRDQTQSGSAFERLANDHTAVSSQKQSSAKHRTNR